MRRCFLVLLVLAALLPSVHGAAAQRERDAGFDLLAVVLTAGDLEAEGFAGYRIDTAGPYGRDADIDYVSGSQRLDRDAVAAVFTEAGEGGSNLATYVLRTDPADPASTPLAVVQTTAYLFADEPGAAVGYEVITDESQMDSPGDIAGTGSDLGEASEISLYLTGEDAIFGLPATELELEILRGRLVLELRTIDYDPETAGTGNPSAEELAKLEALGERLIARADAALAGDSPRLTPLTFRIDSDVPYDPYVLYTLLDGDPIREAEETDDEAFDARVQGQLDRGSTAVLRQEQLLREATEDTPAIFATFEVVKAKSTRAARADMTSLVDRLNDLEAIDAEVAETPDLGDEALVVAIVGTDENGDATLYHQLVVRDGPLIASLAIREVPLTGASVVLSAAAIAELGPAVADCLAAGACDGPVPMPEELTEIVGGDA